VRGLSGEREPEGLVGKLVEEEELRPEGAPAKSLEARV